MTCSHCGNPAHLDFSDRTERCNPCHRSMAFCRCEPVTVQRIPLWLQRAREKRSGLAKDLSGAAA